MASAISATSPSRKEDRYSLAGSLSKFPLPQVPTVSPPLGGVRVPAEAIEAGGTDNAAPGTACSLSRRTRR
ncbi:hypothetical protein GCM10010417_09570 [Streptomyces carpaticus]